MGARSRTRGFGEFELLALVRSTAEREGRGPGVVVGIGDDAAVVRDSGAHTPLVLTTDTMVEKVHFRHAWLSPRELGVRAYRAAVSDVAAMGALPLWALCSLELPRGVRETEVVELTRAMAAEARRTGAALVGGNVSRGPVLAVTTTIAGRCAGRPVLRSGAKPGHVVFVTGTFGGAAAARSALARRRRSAGAAAARANARLSAAFRLPPVRLRFAAEAARAGLLSSMIDVSDGLLQDLGHLASDSRVGLRLDLAMIPVHPAARGHRGLELALAGGEDYELAFTAPPARRTALDRLATRLDVPVTAIGRVVRGAAVVHDADGVPIRIAKAGFDHLRNGSRR